jgi:hypothetical protein
MAQPCPQIVEHLIRDLNSKRFHYKSSLLAMASGKPNGSFENESTRQDLNKHTNQSSTGQKALTGDSMPPAGDHIRMSRQ